MRIITTIFVLFCIMQRALAQPAIDKDVAQAKRQLAELATAIELFKLDCGQYPQTNDWYTTLIRNPGDLIVWRGPYLQDSAKPVDPWQSPTEYSLPHPTAYRLRSFGPDRERDTDDDITIESLLDSKPAVLASSTITNWTHVIEALTPLAHEHGITYRTNIAYRTKLRAIFRSEDGTSNTIAFMKAAESEVKTFGCHLAFPRIRHIDKKVFAFDIIHDEGK